MRTKTMVWIACVFLLLAAAAAAFLAISHHQVVVVEAISRTPLPRAYIILERTSGSPEEVGQTDSSGRLSFWNAPLPLPLRICAQSTFYATDCVSAVGFGQRIIELAVPTGAP